MKNNNRGFYPSQKQGQGPVAKVQIDLKELKGTAICKCGCFFFMAVNTYKILPALLSPNGQEQLLTIPAAKCVSCGEAYEMQQIIAMAKEEKIIV